MNLLQESTKNLASQSCGGATRIIAPSMPSHDCSGSAAGAPAATLRPILYSRGHSRVLVCASVLRSLLPANPPASPVAPALAPPAA